MQYLWQYGTGKLTTGPAVTLDCWAHGGLCVILKEAHTGPLLIFIRLRYLYYTYTEKLMYGTGDYLAYLRYGAMQLFQDKILRGHGNFWSRNKKLTVPYCHEYCTSLNRERLGRKVAEKFPYLVGSIIPGGKYHP